MALDQHRLTDHERANLVAYLDGELEEMETRHLSAKLAPSVTGRREIEALEKTWELLDLLPRVEPSAGLTEKTLTQVLQIEARSGRYVDMAGRTSRLVTRVAVLAVSAALTLAIGYAAARWLWPDRTGRLARDLPLAEHLDEYRDVRSFEFLELLDQSPAFNTEDAE